MSGDSQSLDRSKLEGKGREELATIAAAIGAKVGTRDTKASLVSNILATAGVEAAPAKVAKPRAKKADAAPKADQSELTLAASPAPIATATLAPVEAAPAAPRPPRPRPMLSEPEVRISPVAGGVAVAEEPKADWESSSDDSAPAADRANGQNRNLPNTAYDDSDGGGRNRRRRRRGRDRDGGPEGDGAAPQNNQGTPGNQGNSGNQNGAGNNGNGTTSNGDRPPRPERNDRNDRNDRQGGNQNRQGNNNNDRQPVDRSFEQDRRPRYQKGGNRDERFDADRDRQADNSNFEGEPFSITGIVDLKDDGFGFIRTGGYLPTKDDAYLSVRQAKQYNIRKGDQVLVMARPAGPREKNPAVLNVQSINGKDPEQFKARKKFEDLTPLFPDEKLVLENPMTPTDMTSRIVDLIAPIGKGQRGLIVSPPKAGKTTIMKTIATSIERNNPDVKLMVLLIDERPEEVTDMRRTVKGEVIASTFDRPSEEHTYIAELVIERAKRLVEMGQDVVIILDGITRLSRAYNLANPTSGKIMSGGIDAGALYPPKKFFGAARNIEEGGSLTILATALVETNSRMDEAIFEEFKGTGNMELRLDRKLAERRIYPAIDVDGSSTRHEELLFPRAQLQQVWKLRRVLNGLAEGGNGGPGLELLIDRMKTFKSNDEFLAEVAKGLASAG